MIDEGKTRRGIGEIRDWQEGDASKYQYTTEVFDIDSTGQGQYLVTGRLKGNFPGGTADLRWRLAVTADRISHLQIAP